MVVSRLTCLISCLFHFDVLLPVYPLIYEIMCALKMGKFRSGLDEVVFGAGVVGPFTNEVEIKA